MESDQTKGRERKTAREGGRDDFTYTHIFMYMYEYVCTYFLPFMPTYIYMYVYKLNCLFVYLSVIHACRYIDICTCTQVLRFCAGWSAVGGYIQ